MLLKLVGPSIEPRLGNDPESSEGSYARADARKVDGPSDYDEFVKVLGKLFQGATNLSKMQIQAVGKGVQYPIMRLQPIENKRFVLTQLFGSRGRYNGTETRGGDLRFGGFWVPDLNPTPRNRGDKAYKK